MYIPKNLKVSLWIIVGHNEWTMTPGLITWRSCPGADSISCSAGQDFLGKFALLNTFSGAQIFLRHRNKFSWKLVPDQNWFHRNKIIATDPLNVTPRGRVYHFERSTSRKCEMGRVKLVLAALLFCWSIRVEAENADSPKCSSKSREAYLNKTSPS